MPEKRKPPKRRPAQTVWTFKPIVLTTHKLPKRRKK